MQIEFCGFNLCIGVTVPPGSTTAVAGTLLCDRELLLQNKRSMDLGELLDDGGWPLIVNMYGPMKKFTPITPLCIRSVKKYSGFLGLLIQIIFGVVSLASLTIYSGVIQYTCNFLRKYDFQNAASSTLMTSFQSNFLYLLPYDRPHKGYFLEL